MALISAEAPEPGFNCRLKEKLNADILTKNPMHKENVQVYFLDSGSLVSVKICEVSRRKFSKHCERTDFEFIVPIKLRQVYTTAVLSNSEAFSSKTI